MKASSALIAIILFTGKLSIVSNTYAYHLKQKMNLEYTPPIEGVTCGDYDNNKNACDGQTLCKWIQGSGNNGDCSKLIILLCHRGVTRLDTSSSQKTLECSSGLEQDVIFVLDSSGSVKTQGRWDLQTSWTQNIILNELTDQTRVGLVKYSTDSYYEWWFNWDQTKSTIANHASNMAWQRGWRYGQGFFKAEKTNHF